MDKRLVTLTVIYKQIVCCSYLDWDSTVNFKGEFVQSIQHLNWLSCFYTAHARVSSCMSGRVIPPQNCLFPWGICIYCVVPWVHWTQHAKRHLDWFSSFCTAHGRESLYFTVGCPFSPSKLSLSVGDRYLELTHGSLSPRKPTIQTASRLVWQFLQRSSPWQTKLLNNCKNGQHLYVELRCGLIIPMSLFTTTTTGQPG